MSDTATKKGATSDRPRDIWDDPAAAKKDQKEPEVPSGLQPVRIDGSEASIPLPSPRHPYWLGTTDDSPLQTVTAGGVEFPRALGKLTDERGDPLTNLQRGRIAKLTDDEVALVRQRIAERVVRISGQRRMVLSVRGQRDYPFQPEAGDIPLGRFVYLIRLGDNLPHDWRERPPTTMA